MKPSDRLKEIQDRFIEDDNDWNDINYLLNRVKRLTEVIIRCSQPYEEDLTLLNMSSACYDDLATRQELSRKALEEE